MTLFCIGWIEVEGGWNKVEEGIGSILDEGEEILTMDGTNFICRLWGTCSYVEASLGMATSVVVPITYFE